MARRNVLVLGSEGFARDVCAAINQWHMGDSVIVDKPSLSAGDSEGVFEERTVGTAIFRKVEKIDFVVFVASEATAKNDRLIYERLSKWQKKLVVISDKRLDFAKVDIFIPEHENVTGEHVRFLFRKITGCDEVVTPEPRWRHKKPAVALAILGVTMLLYFYTHPFCKTETLEFEGVTIKVDVPEDFENGEVKDVKVFVIPDAQGQVVKVSFDSEYIHYILKEEKENYEVYSATVLAEAAGDSMTTTVKVAINDTNVKPIKRHGENQDRFELGRRPVAFQRYTPSATFISFLLAVVSAPWKRWLKGG